MTTSLVEYMDLTSFGSNFHMEETACSKSNGGGWECETITSDSPQRIEEVLSEGDRTAAEMIFAEELLDMSFFPAKNFMLPPLLTATSNSESYMRSFQNKKFPIDHEFPAGENHMQSGGDHLLVADNEQNPDEPTLFNSQFVIIVMSVTILILFVVKCVTIRNYRGISDDKRRPLLQNIRENTASTISTVLAKKSNEKTEEEPTLVFI